MSKPSLLPPNATDLERKLEQVSARIDDIPIPIPQLWNPLTCPVNHLPWLAWQVSVDEWDSNWSEQTKRNVIAKSIDVHRHKGTPGAIKQALQSMGYKDVQIIEPKRWKHNGQFLRDGSITHGTEMHWAEFDVHLNAGENPAPEVAAKINRSIQNYKPVRSHLRHLKYTSKFHNGQHLRNGSINRDGGYVNG